jgi:saccharopine dehydrogenase-like NADP-dependent oxidoreductase
VQLIAGNLFSEAGVFPPESIGKDKACFDRIIRHLKERKVNWEKKEY